MTPTKTILLVDDNGIEALAGERMLTKEGFLVLTAGSGEEAVSFIRSERGLVDLIIMDVDLGAGIDGAEAARQILADQDIPIVFATAHSEKEIVEKIENVPSYGYVIKNTGEYVLLATIRNAFKLHDAVLALRQAEERLRSNERLLTAAQELARVGHYTSDLSTGGWRGSPMLNTILGIDERYPHDTAHWTELIASDMRQIVADNFQRTVQTGGRFVFDYKIIRPSDGQTRWVSSIGDIEYAPDGTPLRMIGTLQDITDRKKAEELEYQLIQAQKLEGIGTLAGGIAHDFNNLLAMILGSAELLRSHTADQPQLKRYVDRIIEASERGAAISRQLLIFSKPDGAEFVPISLPHIVNELADMLTHLLPKSITIGAEIAAEDGMILGDIGQIHQALLNIALNSSDAMPDGGTLQIRACLASTEHVRKNFPLAPTASYIAVSISDTGKGMSEETRKRIFDPFFTTKDKGKGSGLGLAIVHGIVKNHGGFIDVDTAPGTGTTFTLYFPGLARQSALPEAQAPVYKGSILIVDDELVIREALEETLKDFGYTVYAAANGTEALALYRDVSATLDLVITDLGMPGMSGEELFRQLSAINPEVKVIISSGYFDKAATEKLTSMGVKKLLAKPYKIADIEFAIQLILSPDDM